MRARQRGVGEELLLAEAGDGVAEVAVDLVPTPMQFGDVGIVAAVRRRGLEREQLSVRVRMLDPAPLEVLVAKAQDVTDTPGKRRAGISPGATDGVGVLQIAELDAEDEARVLETNLTPETQPGSIPKR